MRRIMIATDGSQPAEAALDLAIGLARETAAMLHVVCVRPLAFHDPAGARSGHPSVRTLDGAERIAADAAVRARAAGVRVQAHFLCGSEVDCLLDAVRELRVDLVVVGSRGRGMLGDLLMGTVSRALVHDARTPVIVVKAPAAASRLAS
jgi:nucleotide-binding universal stress UspA family protein